MLLKNNSIKLLTFAVIFVFIGVASEVSAQKSWLDGATIQNWNRSLNTIPKTKKTSRAELQRCASFVREPSLPEDLLLTNSGHTLIGAAQVYGATTLVSVTDGYNESCRPMMYQTYVFADEKLIGTLSPNPMNWQKDGSLINLVPATKDYLIAKFARYRDSDEPCCPSKTKTVIFQVKKAENNRSMLIPTASFEDSFYSYLPSYSAGDLQHGVWRWESLSSSNETITIDKPEDYTLEFESNSQLKVRADCNRGPGKYEANDGVISVSDIAMTRRACPPESSDSKFLSSLSKAVDFRIENNVLVFELSDDSEMRFSRAESKTQNKLEKTSWFWKSSNDSESEITVDDPKKYQISFSIDGGLLLVSDCNRGGGKYDVKDNKLKISSTFLTLMSCGENSLGSRFAQQLEGDKTFRVEHGNLIVEDADGKNTMKFIRGRN